MIKRTAFVGQSFAAALTLTLFATAAAQVAPQDPETTIILVRHAETEFPADAEDPRDPFLHEVGLAQASRLAEMLAPEGLDHVFSTEYRRTRSTARPTAHAVGLEVEAYDPRDLAGFAEQLQTMTGRMLVVGHSNTTPALVEALGGDPGEPIDERMEFNRLYTLTWRDGELSTRVEHYGENLPERLRADDATTRAAARISKAESFAFHSSFWFNLHDALYWRTRPRGGAPEDNACLTSLRGEVQAGWQLADDFYKASMGDRDPRTDPLMRELRFALTRLSAEPFGSEAAVVVELLRGAAAAYQLCLWADHDNRNRAWVDELATLLSDHEASLTRRLSDLYADAWPEMIPVDVVSYSNWSGANTTGDPLHMALSSVDPDNLAPGSLEIVFHEGSHGVFGGGWGKTYEALDTAFSARGLDAQRDIWHSVIFFTTGRVTQEVLRAAGREAYSPYMVRVGVYDELYPMLVEAWQPYLDGEIDLSAAAQRYAAAVAAAR